MIDYFALILVHGLLVIALFRIVQNDALDPAKPTPRSARAKLASKSRDDEGA